MKENLNYAVVGPLLYLYWQKDCVNKRKWVTAAVRSQVPWLCQSRAHEGNIWLIPNGGMLINYKKKKCLKSAIKRKNIFVIYILLIPILKIDCAIIFDP